MEAGYVSPATPPPVAPAGIDLASAIANEERAHQYFLSIHNNLKNIADVLLGSTPSSGEVKDTNGSDGAVAALIDRQNRVWAGLSEIDEQIARINKALGL